jgi:hypothetical protein
MSAHPSLWGGRIHRVRIRGRSACACSPGAPLITRGVLESRAGCPAGSWLFVTRRDYGEDSEKRWVHVPGVLRRPGHLWPPSPPPTTKIEAPRSSERPRGARHGKAFCAAGPCVANALLAALDWAADRAYAKGFAGVTVAWEPTGHRWMVLAQLAAERGIGFVCVQPAASSWAHADERTVSFKALWPHLGRRVARSTVRTRASGRPA